MILADTSVWVDHLRGKDIGLARLLDERKVVVHPFVIGEITLGSLRNRNLVIELLTRLPSIDMATDAEVMRFVTDRKLYGKGIGWIDVHLVASVFLVPGTRLWTCDRLLREICESLSIAAGLD